VWTRDITQAFLQSNQQLLHDVYILPPKELGLQSDVVWRVKSALYGLPEATGQWFATYQPHHTDKEHLARTASLTDPCLFIKGNATTSPANLGVIALQVDDTLVTGSAPFQALEESKSKCFLGIPAQLLGTNKNIRFNGATITQSSSGTISTQQLLYCRSLP
jgi:Reverse transcriptase (RNA-dependent DNA polymerase)